MADNLTLTIGANAAGLRAQLALTQSELRAFTREMNAAANAARRSSSDLDLSRLGQSAAQVNQATAAAARLREELTHGGSEAGSLGSVLNQTFARAGAAIREPLDALAMMKSSLRETAEVAGAVFAVDAIKRFAERNAELGEKLTNLAAAIGTTPEKLGELSAMMSLAGGDAETASRTIERLSRNISEALGNPTSTAARAFQALGISEDELRQKSGSLDDVLRLLAQKFTEFADSPTKTAAFVALLGRGMEQLVPLLKGGANGLDETRQRAQDLGGVLAGSTIAALADSREKMNALGAAATGLGANLAAQLKPTIDAVTQSLTSMIAALNRALGLAATDSAGRLGALTDQLAEVNRGIAEAERGQRVTHGPRFGQREGPAGEGAVERFTHKWIYAMYLLMTARKGISSLQLSKEIGIAQSSAWFMLSRIREACGNDPSVLAGIVSIDETYIGGKEANKHEHKKLHAGRGTVGKTAVVGMRERGGRTKAQTVSGTDAATLHPVIHRNIEVGSMLHTNEHGGYRGIGGLFYQHETISHSAGEYVRDGVSTNDIESVWAVLKRGLHGVYQPRRS